MLVSVCSLGSNLNSTLGQQKFRLSRSTVGFLFSLRLMTFCNFFTVHILLNMDFLCLIYAAFKSQQLVCGVMSENFCTLIYKKRCPIACKDGTYALGDGKVEVQPFTYFYQVLQLNGLSTPLIIRHAQAILLTRDLKLILHEAVWVLGPVQMGLVHPACCRHHTDYASAAA